MGGAHIDAVGFHRHALLRLPDRQLARAREQVCQEAPGLGILVLRHDIGQAGGARQMGEQGGEGFRSPRRGADAHHRTSARNGRMCVLLPGTCCLVHLQSSNERILAHAEHSTGIKA
jgi:hypothetical protein